MEYARDIALANYATSLEEAAVLLKHWLAMVPAVVANQEACNIVLSIRKIYRNIANSKSNYQFSPATKDVMALHNSFIKLCPELVLGGSPAPKGAPSGLVCFICLYISNLSYSLFLFQCASCHGKNKSTDNVKNLSLGGSPSLDDCIMVDWVLIIP